MFSEINQFKVIQKLPDSFDILIDGHYVKVLPAIKEKSQRFCSEDLTFNTIRVKS